MNQDHDPLIHGPRAESGAPAERNGEGPAPAKPGIDLNSTNPAEDFYCLVRSPKEFFDFFQSDAPISKWLVFKALGGLLFFSWLAEFAQGGRWVQGFLNELMPLLHSNVFSMLGSGLDAKMIEDKMAMALLTFAQFKMFLSPLWDLIDLAGLAASTALFLPLLGVARARVSFYSIFFALAYVRWFYVLGVFPGVGSWLMPLVVVAMTIMAVRRLTGLGRFKALMATYGLYWITIMILPVMALGILAVLFFVSR